MSETHFARFSRAVCLVLIILTIAACKVTIEKPIQTVYTVGERIHFDAEYNGTGTIMWRDEFTLPNGLIVIKDNLSFKHGTTNTGKGYPWDFYKENLEVGVHKITAYKEDDEATITITIRSFCDDPETDCSYLNEGQCKVGICDPDTDKCMLVNSENGFPCTDGMTCTENDMCSSGECIGQSTCVGSGVCTSSGCQYSGACEKNADCSYLTSDCHKAACDETTNTCILQVLDNYCYIDGYCLQDGQFNLNNSCQLCDARNANANANDWYLISNKTCSDSDACTLGGWCVEGECISEGPLDCDDDNSCTSDRCDELNGCVYEDLNGDSCYTNSEIQCVSGVCQSGQCQHVVDDGYCLIGGNTCVVDGQYSDDGCRICDSDKQPYGWYWNDSLNEKLCVNEQSSQACGVNKCNWGQCLFSLNDNYCFINNECVLDGQATNDGCYMCNVDQSQYSGEYTENEGCVRYSKKSVLADPYDSSLAPVAFDRDYFNEYQEVPAMTSLNKFNKVFFIAKGGQPVVATCEVLDSKLSIAIRSYPGLAKLHHQEVITLSNNVLDNSFCGIDAMDVNGDGFKEIIVGTPSSDSSSSGIIAFIEVSDIDIRKLGTLDTSFGNFYSLRVSNIENQKYVVLWNRTSLEVYRIYNSEDGTYKITDDPVWSYSVGLPLTDRILNVSINNEATVITEQSGIIVDSVKIHSKLLADGIDVQKPVIQEGILASSAVACDGNVYFSESVDIASGQKSNLYSISTSYETTLKYLGQSEELIENMYCLSGVDWLRMPRDFLFESSRLVGVSINSPIPDKFDYLKVSDYTESLEKLLSVEYLGTLELELKHGNAVTVNQKIHVGNLIISGNGSVLINNPDQVFRNVTVNDGVLRTTSGNSVKIENNLILGSENSDISGTSVSFTGTGRSTLASRVTRPVVIDSISLDKKSTSSRLVIDDRVTVLQINEIEKIKGVLETGDFTKVEYLGGVKTIVGDGTIIIRGPSFSANGLKANNVNVQLYGSDTGNPMQICINGDIDIKADFRVTNANISGTNFPMRFDISEQTVPVVEIKDSNMDMQDYDSQVSLISLKGGEKDISIVRIQNVTLNNLPDDAYVWMEYDPNVMHDWTFRLKDANKSDIPFYIKPPFTDYFEPILENSPADTEYIGYHRVGFIDGTNCDMWPKEITTNELEEEIVSKRLMLTGAYHDYDANPETAKIISEYVKKAISKNSLILGSKNSLAISEAAIRWKLPDNGFASSTVKVAIDAIANIGYVLDASYLCTEEDIQEGLCDFLSRDNAIIGNAGIISGEFLSGEKINDSTQVLTRKHINRRSENEIAQMDVDTLIFAAPKIAFLRKYILSDFNMIVLADKVMGVVEDGLDESIIEIKWTGRGDSVDEINYQNERLESLVKIFAYEPKGPAYGVIAASRVTGIKSLIVKNKPNYITMGTELPESLATNSLVNITTEAHWTVQGFHADETGGFLDYLDGTLSEENWDEPSDFFPLGQGVLYDSHHYIELNALDMLKMETRPSSEGTKVTWRLNVPENHQMVEGGLAAIISSNYRYFGKRHIADTTNVAPYKRSVILIGHDNIVAEDIYHKMFQDIDQVDSDAYDTYSEIEYCVDWNRKNPGSNVGEKCRTIFTGNVGVDHQRYCVGICIRAQECRESRLRLHCAPYDSLEKVACFDGNCPTNEAEAQILSDEFYRNVCFPATAEIQEEKCLGDGFVGATILCKENGEITNYAFSEEVPNWNYSECARIALRDGVDPFPEPLDVSLSDASLRTIFQTHKEKIIDDIKASNRRWELINERNEFQVAEGGPESSGSLSDRVYRQLQFALSNGEMLKLYKQLGKRRDKSRSYYVTGGTGWNEAYSITSSISLYGPDNHIVLQALFAAGLSAFYQTKKYNPPDSEDEYDLVPSLNINNFFEVENRNAYTHDSKSSIHVNSIDMPYGYMARSWFQIRNFNLQNSLLFEGSDQQQVDISERSEGFQDPYMNNYVFVKKPAMLSSYVERWYTLQDTINSLLSTLREKREDAIFGDSVRQRLALLSQVLNEYSNQQVNASSEQIMDLKMLVEALTALKEEILFMADEYEYRSTVVLRDMADKIEMLDEKCNNTDRDFQEAVDSINDISDGMKDSIDGFKSVAQSIHEWATDDEILDAIKEYDELGQLDSISLEGKEWYTSFQTIGEVVDILSSVGGAISAFISLMELFGVFEDDPCPGNDRQFLEINVLGLQQDIDTVEQIVSVTKSNLAMIEFQMQHAMMSAEYHLKSQQIYAEFQQDLAEFQEFVGQAWEPDQFDRYGLGNTCKGLRGAVETVQKEMYSTSQLLNTSMGFGYQAPYFNLPPAYIGMNNGNPVFQNYNNKGFHISLWDSLANFRLNTPRFWGVDELEKVSDVDTALREYINNIRETAGDTDSNIGSVISEMTSSYSEDLKDRINLMDSALFTRSPVGFPANYEPFTYVVKTLRRSPCYIEEENTQQKNCDSNGENCSEEDLIVNQARYCDRSGNIDDDSCLFGNCEYGDLADVFLSKGAVKFKVTPEDLAASSYIDIVEEDGIPFSTPTIYDIFYRVYYADRWCQYNVYTGMQTRCCYVQDLDQDGVEGETPEECPESGNVSESFDFFAYGFQGQNQGGLFAVNAAPEMLLPWNGSSPPCDDYSAVNFWEPGTPLGSSFISRYACTKQLHSLPEYYKIMAKSPVTPGMGENQSIVNEFQINAESSWGLSYLSNSAVRGMPVLGTWYLIYDGRRAESLTTALKTANSDYSLSIPRSIAFNSERDTHNVPIELLEQLGDEYDTPYSYYRMIYQDSSLSEEQKKTYDIDSIKHIDIVFVVSKTPSQEVYWGESRE